MSVCPINDTRDPRGDCSAYDKNMGTDLIGVSTKESMNNTQPLPPLLACPLDIFMHIFKYNSLGEVVKLMTCSKELMKMGKEMHLEHYIWEYLCKYKWNLPSLPNSTYPISQELFLNNKYYQEQCMRKYFPYASQIISGLTSDNENIICKNDDKALFVGKVRESNRSVQSASPFPCSETGFKYSTVYEKTLDILMKLFLPSFLRNHIKSNMQYYDPLVFKSIPFKVGGARNRGEAYFCLDPRVINYFEVEIVPLSEETEGNLNTGDNNDGHLGGSRNITGASDLDEEDFEQLENCECVAVGLSTNCFLKKNLFPGWDSESYGYHGDDGAIFHGRGWQLSCYGPTFGFGDVVGCGMNLCTQTIFFTLNGEYLGDAFTNVRTDIPLYPTVGIDSKCAVKFNFGLKEFQFDLKTFIDTSLY